MTAPMMARTTTDEATALRRKLDDRTAVVSVVGLGYAGLPLAIAFADAGFRVVAMDLDRDRVDALNEGRSYLDEVPSERVAALVDAQAARAIYGPSGPPVSKLLEQQGEACAGLELPLP